MILIISSWYGEPGVSFRIYFKVHKLIRHQLIEQVMYPFGLEAADSETVLSLVSTTTANTKKLEVRGPEVDKRNKTINYGLWLPYLNIHNSSNYLKTYLEYYFDALVILFDKYDIPEDVIRAIQRKVENEVLGNLEYEYRD
ncbi:hypothetical protein [Mucilaginibacter antarcticus]|uniref:Uncharacterized protein n=1 Tax=Mucilaginibacter antarcticus TaxID=1855725 RepID=A0ABW5XQI3_9SPHI